LFRGAKPPKAPRGDGTASLIYMQNTHLDFCIASNVHKYILTVMLTHGVKLHWNLRMGSGRIAEIQGDKLCCYATGLELINTNVETARNDLPIIHDTFRRKQDVKLSSGTAIVASA